MQVKYDNEWYKDEDLAKLSTGAILIKPLKKIVWEGELQEIIKENENPILEMKIVPPPGYEVDKDNCTFEKIVFKKVINPITWESKFVGKEINGWYITDDSNICSYSCPNGSILEQCIFKTKKQAESALAYAQLTQLMALPEYNGDWEPDLNDGNEKYVIHRIKDKIIGLYSYKNIHFQLSFKSSAIRDKFMKEQEVLLRQYFMMD